MKNILILNAHTSSDSFCDAISKTYYSFAKEAGNNVELVNVRDLNFDINFLATRESDEAEILNQRKLILWANEVIIVIPNWWSGVPAKFKGYIDRVFVSSFAFEYGANGMPKGLLTDKSAFVYITQDSPCFWTKLFVGDPLWKMINRGVLKFCGFNVKGHKIFSTVRKSSEKKRKAWLKEVQNRAKS